MDIMEVVEICNGMVNDVMDPRCLHFLYLPESDCRCFRGAILSVSHPSVKVHYIGTRNVQLMHCSGGDFC